MVLSILYYRTSLVTRSLPNSELRKKPRTKDVTVKFVNRTGKTLIVLDLEGREIKRFEPEGFSASVVRVAHHKCGYEDGIPIFDREYTSQGLLQLDEGLLIVPRDLFEQMRGDSGRPRVATPYGVLSEDESEIWCEGLEVPSHLGNELRTRTVFNSEGGVATW